MKIFFEKSIDIYIGSENLFSINQCIYVWSDQEGVDGWSPGIGLIGRGGVDDREVGIGLIGRGVDGKEPRLISLKFLGRGLVLDEWLIEDIKGKVESDLIWLGKTTMI